MFKSQILPIVSRLLSEYGMFVVLMLLCVYYSMATIKEQQPTGEEAGEQVADQLLAKDPKPNTVLILGRTTAEDTEFAEVVKAKLDEGGVTETQIALGEPFDARKAIVAYTTEGTQLDCIATTQSTSGWTLLDNLSKRFPNLGRTEIVRPHSYRWPTFLKTENLVGIASRIAVIAIMAIGMTMVIITAGIDLSVGSLVALSAVATAWFAREMGGPNVGTTAVALCCLGGVVVCGLCGVFNGVLITLFGLPPFLVTLGMMLIASGTAWTLADGQSINSFPDSFHSLDHGLTWSIPNPIVLMILLYAVAHVVMSHMTIGRYIYAVGGNPEAARLSGVPVRRVLLFVYATTGCLAGLAGVLMASRFLAGDPKYGAMYELTVIAAVVVGGTSLSGGEGKILGTLIGAFLIAVTQSGMNHTQVSDYTQKIVLGCIILAAVLLDQLNRRPWNWPAWLRRPKAVTTSDDAEL